MKNTIEGISSRLEDAEKWISNVDNREMEITQAEQKKKIKNEDSLRDF